MDIFLRYARKTTEMPNNFPTRAYDARILFILDGEGEIRFSDKTVELKKNTLCYYPAGTNYFPVSTKEHPLLFVTINFDLTRDYIYQKTVMPPVPLDKYDGIYALPSHLKCGYEIFEKYFVLQGAYFFKELFLDVAEEFGKATDISIEIAEAYLKSIILKLVEYKNHNENELYKRILNYISENYSTIKSNAQIANALNYHEYYINALFKRSTGTTLHRYIMMCKLKKGAKLLLSTSKSVNEISEEVGFKNPDHFSKRFYNEFGLSPTKYRNSYKFI